MTNPPNKYRTPMQSIRLFFTGIAMGTADVIPGVSGGTMAFILGIYEDLINAIKSFNLDVIKLVFQLKFKEVFARIPWWFLIVLFTGIGAAFFSLAQVVSWLLENQSILLFSFFFGLILASIIAVGAVVKWSPRTIVALVIGTIVAYVIVGLVPLAMPHDPITLFLSGSIAIMAMILPGISGSFLLLILGQYEFVIESISSLNLMALIPFALGTVVGITLFARVLSWLFKHYEQVTIALLVGFMAGSLRKIWPWKEVLETRVDRHGEVVPYIERNVLPTFASQEFLIALGLCIVGFVIVTALDHLQSGSNPLLRPFTGNRRAAELPAAQHPDQATR